MRKPAFVLVPLLVLAVVIGAVGCDGGQAMTPEAKEIADFLNDKHVNAVLWEAWNIFDEWVYARLLYESSPRLGVDFSRFKDQENALSARARQNYQDAMGIYPPPSLKVVWDDIIAWPKQLYEHFYQTSNPYSAWLLGQASRRYADAWLRLKNICREHDIDMEWPLPRDFPKLATPTFNL